MTFSVYLQVANLGRSLAFYRDGLGLEVTWNDDELAVLRGPVNPPARWSSAKSAGMLGTAWAKPG
jgi:catechol 2,3-dioxygenase-like lactoylglutathione lyase family enzyme